MNPDLQAVYQQMQQAQQHAIFMGYSTYAAILVCAVFSILIFWKLCQIKTLLQSPSRAKQVVQTVSHPATVAPMSRRAADDSRYLPKK